MLYVVRRVSILQGRAMSLNPNIRDECLLGEVPAQFPSLMR